MLSLCLPLHSLIFSYFNPTSLSLLTAHSKKPQGPSCSPAVAALSLTWARPSVLKLLTVTPAVTSSVRPGATWRLHILHGNSEREMLHRLGWTRDIYSCVEKAQSSLCVIHLHVNFHFDVELRLSPSWVGGNIGSTDATKTCHNLNTYIFETNNHKVINNISLDSL
jgi:hypothetical protein